LRTDLNLSGTATKCQIPAVRNATNGKIQQRDLSQQRGEWRRVSAD
jgi:hypothetical protein